MISIEMNTALRAHFQDLGSPYDDIDILPLSGYEDTKSPFMIYSEFPGSLSEEKFFIYVSNVIYVIHDNDISRMKDVGYELNKFFHVGDRVEGVKSLLTSPYDNSEPLRYRITTIRKVGGGTNPPVEREGRSNMSLNFRVVYMDAAGSIP